MNIKILFTTQDHVMSNLIRKVTKEPASHCALEIPKWGIIVHSNKRGVHIASAKNFRNNNKIIHELISTKKWTFSQVKAILNNDEFIPYDICGFLFIGISLILRNYFKIPLPKTNLWDTTGMFCSEWVSSIASSKCDPMLTPYGLYMLLKKSGEWME